MVIFNLFPNGKMNCITMSFDDGRIYDRKVVSILNQYHMKGTVKMHDIYKGTKQTHLTRCTEVK